MKLCDFGISKLLNENKLDEQCGTPPYMAPEIFKGKAYNGFKADI
jgi:serine/threonine protein kinase